MPDAYSGHPIYSVIQGIQLKRLSGRTRSDRPYSLHRCDASLPEHEALPSSNKMCLQTEAVIFICSGECLTDLSDRVLPDCSSSCIPCNIEYIG